ncbi:TetR/AcrR family transcriptional regulator [Gordonia rhizosphera]|uniref:Putative TetR family transcriptional regulator n=1 Tax=Gordonia rhizosphera NBRC 16068 TaxID=1108045 RepID=K6WIY8_9ACTN|nr:TetR/AcrR family transcriptional regulator [Gordonia rhizosphera]GAB93746.1 putative TetR family transcriptional regulator [Gordonia rhizosphera NBRC 16068]
MSPSKTRTPATEVRSALIAAGRRILEKEGAAALTVRAVATEAGVAPMGVYNHFEGKEGLLNAVVTAGYAEFADTVAATDSDAAMRLRNSGRNYRAFALANPTLYSLMFSLECRADDEVAGRAFEVLADIIRFGQAGGTIRDGDALMLAAQTWACVHGAVSLELGASFPPFIDPAEAYEQVLDLVARGLSSPPDGPSPSGTMTP